MVHMGDMAQAWEVALRGIWPTWATCGTVVVWGHGSSCRPGSRAACFCNVFVTLCSSDCFYDVSVIGVIVNML